MWLACRRVLMAWPAWLSWLALLAARRVAEEEGLWLVTLEVVRALPLLLPFRVFVRPRVGRFERRGKVEGEWRG